MFGYRRGIATLLALAAVGVLAWMGVPESTAQSTRPATLATRPQLGEGSVRIVVLPEVAPKDVPPYTGPAWGDQAMTIPRLNNADLSANALITPGVPLFCHRGEIRSLESGVLVSKLEEGPFRELSREPVGQFSADGKYLTVREDKTAYVFEVKTGKTVLKVPDAPEIFCMSVDGEFLTVTGSGELAVRGVSLNNDGRRRLFGVKAWGSGARFSPDGRYLLTDGSRAGVHIHDVRTEKRVATIPFEVRDERWRTVWEFTADGKGVVIVDRESLRVPDRNLLRTMNHGHEVLDILVTDLSGRKIRSCKIIAPESRGHAFNSDATLVQTRESCTIDVATGLRLSQTVLEGWSRVVWISPSQLYLYRRRLYAMTVSRDRYAASIKAAMDPKVPAHLRPGQSLDVQLEVRGLDGRPWEAMQTDMQEWYSTLLTGRGFKVARGSPTVLRVTLGFKRGEGRAVVAALTKSLSVPGRSEPVWTRTYRYDRTARGATAIAAEETEEANVFELIRANQSKQNGKILSVQDVPDYIPVDPSLLQLPERGN